MFVAMVEILTNCDVLHVVVAMLLCCLDFLDEHTLKHYRWMSLSVCLMLRTLNVGKRSVTKSVNKFFLKMRQISIKNGNTMKK